MDGEWEGPLIPNVKYKVSGGVGGREGVSPSISVRNKTEEMV